ncbi:helix-turn-helix transcriptional regulator [Pseudoalteromonas sp. OOF1S-7]|uniref:helix-turn-helix domain-containing protein n=1 Tax=Pseudoalteromonas sp. OOF1S-7 TaxID=2917757 RepID=UPI001EF5D6A7|nr:helix-turn-helix transcriptional regulator [Pseudoalteromonas sp. OOF1S-7]MCG7533925.1 helix-turn-helix domain-containing protein [Pseudoalteromonas sp. OOF1S-7]
MTSTVTCKIPTETMINPFALGGGVPSPHQDKAQEFDLLRAPRGAQLLKYARKSRGYTQAESAASYGIEERTLRRWENNEFNPRWNDVISLLEDVYFMDIMQAIAGVRSMQAQGISV